MQRILLGLALVGLVGGFISTGEASAAQAKSRPTSSHVALASHRSHMSRANHAHRATHVVRSNHKTQPTRTAHVSHKARSGRSAHANRSLKKHRSAHVGKKVAWNAPARRYFGTRLYYSNAFRGMIPGTGYGGFRRPAFGNRGY